MFEGPFATQDSDTPARGDTAAGTDASFGVGRGEAYGSWARPLLLPLSAVFRPWPGGATGSRGHFPRSSEPRPFGLSQAGQAATAPGDTHRPISQRSPGSSCLSRSRRKRGRRHPRPRSRPTPSTPQPGARRWRQVRPAPGVERLRHGPGRGAAPRTTRAGRGLAARPSRPAPRLVGTRTPLNEDGSREQGWAQPPHPDPTMTPPFISSKFWGVPEPNPGV